MMAGMGLWMLFWGLFLLVVLVLAVLGIIALVRHLSTPPRSAPRAGDSPRTHPGRAHPTAHHHDRNCIPVVDDQRPPCACGSTEREHRR